MNIDGSGKIQLTNNTPIIDVTPDWSPDGSQIVFSSNRGGGFDLYVMNDDGTGVTRLTSGAPSDFDPVWSPDGNRIAFSRTIPAQQTEVFVLDLTDATLTNLTGNPASDRAAEWSPDGTQIAFVSDRDGDLDVYAMNADGTGVRQLTNDPARDNVPAWSPDGSLIAFSSDRANPGVAFDLYVMSAVDGSGVNRVTALRGDDPSWQALPPVAAVQNILDSVLDLVSTGDLNPGQGNALGSKLDAAVKKLDQNNIQAAINQLQAFINQVNAFINSGTLTAARDNPSSTVLNRLSTS